LAGILEWVFFYGILITNFSNFFFTGQSDIGQLYSLDSRGRY